MNASRSLGEAVAQRMGIQLGAHEERDFEDGEHKARPLVSVRGKDVFVISSLHGDRQLSVNDKLCRLLFFIGALADASAARVTAVLPYLCYSRKEQKTQPRDPVHTRYIARLFEAVGTHRVVAMDVHNLAAFQNAFRCATDHLDAVKLFVNYFSPVLHREEVVVVSPDAGGVKRAERFRLALSRALDRPVTSGFMEKHRRGNEIWGQAVVGDVRGKVAIIIDDLISTGNTLARAAVACHESGSRRIYAAASHGLFVGDAQITLAKAPLEEIVITDSVPPFRLSPEWTRSKLAVLETAPLLADAIRRISSGNSLTDLLQD